MAGANAVLYGNISTAQGKELVTQVTILHMRVAKNKFNTSKAKIIVVTLN